MNHSKFFRKFIKSIEGYSDYSNHNVNFSNFEEKLKKLENSNDMLNFNNDLNNDINNLRNKIHNTKSKTVSDEDNKNKLLGFLGVKQIELYTNSQDIISDIEDHEKQLARSKDLLISNEKRNMHRKDMIRNKIQKNLYLLLVILLCFFIIIINP